MRPARAARLAPFGTTIFSEMTRLAQAHGAVNLAQGFPDFEGPRELIEAAQRAIGCGDNQYARSQGHPELVRAVSRQVAGSRGLEYDPLAEVGVFAGATEGIAAAMLGMLDPRDEVILFEPFYDSYPACIAMAGAVARHCTLRAPHFELDATDLESLVGPRTKLVLLNAPHNPTGRVFTTEELEALAAVVRKHDLRVVTDEVYEHLVYEGATHRSLSTFSGMRDRTLVISSLGKTFSFTGWKIGWATGPADMIAATQAAHQFLTFAVNTPMQRAAAFALENLGPEFRAELVRDYAERRRFLCDALESAGLQVHPAQGAYFVLADFGAVHAGDDRSFVTRLIEEVGVAAIPPSVFYAREPEEGRRMVRFAFCKKMETLEEAARRLERLRPC